MIIDKIENISMYTELIPDAAAGFTAKLMEKTILGKHVLSENIYANIEMYNTKSLQDGKFESHDRYIDIQILLKGKERIYITGRTGLTVSVPYNGDKDITFYSDDVDKYNFEVLDGTNFIMIFPHEAHASQIAIDTSEEVLKLVIKIKVPR